MSENAGPRSILLTAGTSVLSGLQRLGVSPVGDAMPQITAEWMQGHGVGVDGASAELSTAAQLSLAPGDQVTFFATDTDEGRHAARLLCRLISLRYRVDAVVESVDGLTMADPDAFRGRGLHQLVDKLDRAVSVAREQGLEPVLGISGGIKPVVPYVAIYAMLRGIRLVHVFERSDQLIALPALPIEFGWERIRRAKNAWRTLVSEGAVDARRLQQELAADFPATEGLFEREGDLATLSAFGQMLLGDVERAEQCQVLLAPRAYAVYDSLSGPRKKLVDALLSRLRNPTWRNSRYHAFAGTTLDVWKPLQSPVRFAGWVEGNILRVGLIFTDHGTYERMLPGVERAEFHRIEWRPWVPAQTTESLAGEEYDVPEGLEVALQAAEESGRQAEVALTLATDTEAAFRREVEDLEAQLAEALDQREELHGRTATESWGFLRRLWWAMARR